jgi:hypothetical protein
MDNSIVSACEQNAARLATLGGWPAWFDARKSLVSRIPSDDTGAPGFDAGVACALGLIPLAKQRLSATLHAAYTEAAVEQVRTESTSMDPDSETCWWLAACSVCREGTVSTAAFSDQVEQFRLLAGDPARRANAARGALDNMKKNFVLMDGIPFVIRDGGLQGAYLNGHEWGVQYAEAYGLFFIGTFRATLGLENFTFSDRVDAKGRPMSGPVHGSRQFVKVSTFNELAAATAIVRGHLG